MNEVKQLLDNEAFPRSQAYDDAWMLDNQMGPNALWLTEWLDERLDLAPGMRVLDLGCGKAMSSIFLARERGVRVWAADWWMDPDPNWRRAREAGVDSLICPVKVEAHAIPFAAGFFDAIVSIDAYQYFGTDELYLNYLTRFLRPGGVLGVVVPGLTQPLSGGPPRHLLEPQANGKVFWEDACRSFKTLAFWRALWSSCPKVDEVAVDTLADGWRHWRDFERALELSGRAIFPSDAESLERDGGRTVGFHRLVARRTPLQDDNLYDPRLGVLAGVDS